VLAGKIKLLCALAISVSLAALGGTNFTPMDLQGQTFIHDPSTIVRDGTIFFVFATGPGIRIKSSADLTNWQNGDSVFHTPPAWAKMFAPNFSGYFWAPDVVRVNGRFFLYYACSVFGKQTSVIGLASSAALNPSTKNVFWQDCGAVISSTNGMPFNAIDPSAFLDRDGKLWLAFGSYWQGIFLTELNPETGLRRDTNVPPQQIAWNHSIEAACLTRHEKFYYLFVNWGQCCEGTNSTYKVRVGRAEKITGPYRDREGNDLATGGGSAFLSSSGRFIGPGHIGIVDDGGTNGVTFFSYHYYDASTQGRSRLAIGKIDWTSGWPVATN
jgi:arabinan endo-1,5-alpha-L-arabinosidase